MKTVKKLVFYGSFSSIIHAKKRSLKKGFSLIELVLAIVVVAIALAALPKIVSQTQKSNELAIKQELTYSAKTLMGRIISMPWDSTAFKTMCEQDRGGTCNKDDIKSYLRSNGNSRIPIYNSIELNGKSGSKSRPGSLIAGAGSNIYTYGNRISNSNKEVIYTPGDNSYGFNDNKNDIDDFRLVSFKSKNEQASNEDFISDMTFVTDVAYVTKFSHDDQYSTPINGKPTNVKRVKVTVKDTDGYSSTLYFYAPNIGMNQPLAMKY